MRYLLVTVLAVMLSLPAIAQDFGKGLEAYERGDYATALREWRPLAEQGDANAEYNLGLMHRDGLGVPQDYGETVKWYRSAAEQGHTMAQYNLGVMYSKGPGVPLDYVEAVKWLRLAAEQGDARAQTNLGFMYAHGRGVLQDDVRAYLWFHLAAAQGDRNAMNNRGIVAKRMAPADVSEAQEMAREWIEEQLAKQGQTK